MIAVIFLKVSKEANGFIFNINPVKNKITYLTKSKKGIRRERNQDRVMFIEGSSFTVFMLFDGVSSLPTSFKFISEYKKNVKAKIKYFDQEGSNIDQLLFESHQEVIKQKVIGMSTLSVLMINHGGNRVFYINIGDTRIYAVTNKYIERFTKDDSPSEGSNMITKCLGMEGLTSEDFKKHEIEMHNNFLMCTDGFYTLMEKRKKEYFETFNLKYFRSIEKRISTFQHRVNKDDSTYILIRNEVSN